MDSTRDERTDINAQAAAASVQATDGADPMALLRDVEIELTLEIGRRRMKIADLLRLGPGQMVELEKMAGEPLELLVNGRLIARGEAVVIGERYGVRITEIVAADGVGR